MLRNLDSRESDAGNIRVSLDWDSDTNEVLVSAEDRRTGKRVSVKVDPANARRAYEHPFAYAEQLVSLPCPA